MRGIPGGVPKPRGSTEDVLGNIGEMFGKDDEYKKKLLNEYMNMRLGKGPGQHIPAEEAIVAARNSVPLPEKAQLYREIGRKVGRGVQNLENFGKSVESAGVAATGGILKGAQVGGYLGGKGGAALKAASTLAQPLEVKSGLRYGAEEFWGPELEELNRKRKGRQYYDDRLWTGN